MVQRRVLGRGPRSRAVEVAREAKPRVVVFFADPPNNLYQLVQWLKPFEAIREEWRPLILTMEVDTFRRVRALTALPVIYCDRSILIERVIEEVQPQIICYVNQNQQNFRMLRFAEQRHVFLSHGESDKSYSASNQVKAYDYTLVAGEAARERLGRLFRFDPETRTKLVGRPALEFFPDEHRLARDGRTIVLYAPTFEGDRTSMAYSSVATHGVTLVRRLVADGGFRVIYRPHPLLGSVRAENRQADREIRTMLRGTDHVVDDDEYGWQIVEADACITDISAVAYDWLNTGKPLVVTEPALPGIEIPRSRLLDALDLLTVEGARQIVSVLDSMGEDPTLGQTLQELRSLYFSFDEHETAVQKLARAFREIVSES